MVRFLTRQAERDFVADVRIELMAEARLVTPCEKARACGLQYGAET